MVVEAGIETVEPQRIAVLADVRVFRGVQADARAVSLRIIGESCRQVIAAALPVRNQLLKKQGVRAKVDHPQSLLRGWFGVVDHRERGWRCGFSRLHGTAG